MEASAFNSQLDFRIVRLFNVYGPRLHGRVVSNYVKNALANLPLEINGSGKQTRCFTYIDDAIKAFNKILEQDNCKNQIFNVGSNDEISIEDFAKKVISTLNSKSKLKKVSYEEQFGNSYEDIERRVPSISKIKEFIDWNAETFGRWHQTNGKNRNPMRKFFYGKQKISNQDINAVVRTLKSNVISQGPETEKIRK